MAGALRGGGRARVRRRGRGETRQIRAERSSRENSEFYANAGRAVRTLAEELPRAFHSDFTYDIYREDVTLVDRLTLSGHQKVSRGKRAYARAFWRLRLQGRILFRKVSAEVLRMWSPSEKTLCVRWQVQGLPRIISAFGATAAVFDGISEFKLDSDGLIYEHRVDNVDWDVSRFRERLSYLQNALAPQQQQPVPVPGGRPGTPPQQSNPAFNEPASVRSASCSIEATNSTAEHGTICAVSAVVEENETDHKEHSTTECGSNAECDESTPPPSRLTDMLPEQLGETHAHRLASLLSGEGESSSSVFSPLVEMSAAQLLTHAGELLGRSSDDDEDDDDAADDDDSSPSPHACGRDGRVKPATSTAVSAPAAS